jgi:hypothetical protein
VIRQSCLSLVTEVHVNIFFEFELLYLVEDLALSILGPHVAMVDVPVDLRTLACGISRLLRAQVCVMALRLAGEAGHVHVVQLGHRIEHSDFVQSVRRYFRLLTVGRLVPVFTTAVANNLGNTRTTHERGVDVIAVCGYFTLVNPVLFLGEIRNYGQLQVLWRDHVPDVGELALRAQWTEPQHVVGAQPRARHKCGVSRFERVIEVAVVGAQLAEAALEVGTHLRLFVARTAAQSAVAGHVDHGAILGIRMLVQAVLALLALTMLLVKAANGDARLVEVVHELTLTAFLATVAHPVDANTLLAFLLVDGQIDRCQMRLYVVYGHESWGLYHATTA